MKPEWKNFDPRKGYDQELPFERRYVLLIVKGNPEEGLETSRYVVGYLRFAAGDKDSPQFIMPGCDFSFPKPSYRADSIEGYFEHAGRILAWADCLGDDFYLPGWPGQLSGDNSTRYGKRESL